MTDKEKEKLKQLQAQLKKMQSIVDSLTGNKAKSLPRR